MFNISQVKPHSSGQEGLGSNLSCVPQRTSSQSIWQLEAQASSFSIWLIVSISVVLFCCDMYKHVYSCVFMYVQVWGEQEVDAEYIPWLCSTLYTEARFLSWNPELSNPASLVSLHAPGIPCLCLAGNTEITGRPPHPPIVYMDARVPNSLGSRVYSASSSPTEPSPSSLWP